MREKQRNFVSLRHVSPEKVGNCRIVFDFSRDSEGRQNCIFVDD
jgi:hypothetical protein